MATNAEMVGFEKIVRMDNWEVKAAPKAGFDAPSRRVFHFVAAEDVLPTVLTGYGPLSTVVRTSGNADPPGSTRAVA
jgi:hypothetical protein